MSAASPPDIIVNHKTANYLIECKVVKGISLPLTRLSPHQHDYLMRYDDISECHHGHVAVMFYNGQRGRGRVLRAWLVPAPYWSRYQEKYPRKSLAMKHCESDLGSNELTWIPGRGWELPDWV